MTPTELRAALVQWARDQESETDAVKYWLSAYGPKRGGYPPHWCGAFCLAGLHAIGVAQEVRWVIKKGIEAWKPPPKRTADPKPGDVAYFKRGEHHAIVTGVSKHMVGLVNGNSRNETNRTGPSMVVINEVPRSTVAAFYSIEPYLKAYADALDQTDNLRA